MPKPTPAVHSADIPITSPVVERLPELLDVHRLALHIHQTLWDTGDALPLVLSGWIHQDARGHLAEAVKALTEASRVVIDLGRALS